MKTLSHRQDAKRQKKPNSLLSCKPVSLNAFQRQGNASRRDAETLSFSNPKNKVNFVQERNENHERSHSQERVLGDGISHGSRFGIHQISLVSYFHAFLHCLEKNVFSFVTSCLRVRRVLNVFNQCSFAALQPPAKLKWLCLFYSSSLKAPFGFAKICSPSSLFGYPANPLSSSSRLTASQSNSPLGLRLIDRWTDRLLGLNRSVKSRFATVQPISPLAAISSPSISRSASLSRYLAILLFSSLAITLLSPLHSESIPQRYPLDRYNDLRKHLPFGKPTVIETEAPKPPPFTEDLTLLGFSKVGSGYFVSLANKKTQKKIFLSPKEKPDGITVAEVINNSEMSKVEIKLKKGTEIASVKFDPKYISPPSFGNPIPNVPPPTVQNGLPQNQPPIPATNHQPNVSTPNTLPLEEENNPNAINPPNAPPTSTSTPPNKTPVIRRTRTIIVPTQSP